MEMQVRKVVTSTAGIGGEAINVVGRMKEISPIN